MSSNRPSDYPFWFRVVVVTTLALFVVNVFFFAAPLAVAIPAISSTLAMKDILTALGTLIATFVGAWLAFKFAEMRADKERIESEVAAGNRALFTLAFMWDEIRQHQKEVVEPNRGKRDAWLNLRAVGYSMNDKRSFDMKELAFLMQSDPSTFQRLFLEEDRFRMAAQLVESHRELIFDHAWPRLEAAGLQIGQSADEAEIRKILGPSIVKRLIVTTDAFIRNFDENAKSLPEAFVALRAALKKIYPDRKFVNFSFSG